MLASSTSCLYELWQTHSAPMLPINGFWPIFSEDNIQKFLAGTDVSPIATRPVDIPAAKQARSQIINFQKMVSELSPDTYACLETYTAFESERLAMFDLILAPADQELHERLNDIVYGKLADMLYPQSVAHLAAHVDELEPASPGVADAQALLQQIWSETSRLGSVATQFQTINHHRLALRPYVKAHFGFVDDLLAPFKTHSTLKSEELAQLLDATIDHVLPTRDGWKATVLPGKPNVFIDLHNRSVTIPGERTYSLSHAKTLAVHEIGVHVLRAHNGAHSKEKLAGIGMPGYGPTEEAFGVLLGNASAPVYHQINSLIPLAIIEYAGRPEQPTFRQVFEFAQSLIIALANPTRTQLAHKMPEYSRAAFARTIRVLRLGTNELIDRSTTKYWYGQLQISRYLDTHEPSAATISRLLAGKYDCLNTAHFELITAHHTS